MTEFSDWMTKRFIDWRGDTRQTVSDFAQYVGVSQQVMSNWLNKGDTMPQMANVLKLSNRFGPEVYDVLGLPQPLYVRELGAVPQSIKERFLAAANEISTAIYGTAMDPESPEALKMAKSIMEKYGFRVSDTTQ